MSDDDVRRIAAAYPPEARFTPPEVREQWFTDAQRAAWEARFGARTSFPGAQQ